MNTSLSKLQEVVKDREARRAAVHVVTESQTGLSDTCFQTQLNNTAGKTNKLNFKT